MDSFVLCFRYPSFSATHMYTCTHARTHAGDHPSGAESRGGGGYCAVGRSCGARLARSRLGHPHAGPRIRRRRCRCVLDVAPCRPRVFRGNRDSFLFVCVLINWSHACVAVVAGLFIWAGVDSFFTFPVCHVVCACRIRLWGTVAGHSSAGRRSAGVSAGCRWRRNGRGKRPVPRTWGGRGMRGEMIAHAPARLTMVSVSAWRPCRLPVSSFRPGLTRRQQPRRIAQWRQRARRWIPRPPPPWNDYRYYEPAVPITWRVCFLCESDH